MPPSGPFGVVSVMDDMDLLRMIEAAGDGRPAGIRASRHVEVRPRSGPGAAIGSPASPRLDPRDQRLLPGEPLELPDAEPDKDGEGDQRRRRPGRSACASRRTFAQSALGAPSSGAAALTSLRSGPLRPGACIAGRSSGPSAGGEGRSQGRAPAAPRGERGPRTAGRSVNSTYSARPTTMKPTIMMMKTAGPSPASLKA